MEACKKVVVVMGLVVALALVANGAEQFTMCGMTMDGLSRCKPAVTGSNPPNPTWKCCKALSKADLTCFCQKMKTNAKAFGINVDQAKKVPGLCNLKLSKPFKC